MPYRFLAVTKENIPEIVIFRKVHFLLIYSLLGVLLKLARVRFFSRGTPAKLGSNLKTRQ